ncbi:helix-turn-helix domain-containing protein [Spirosoma arboris]|nr:helix-turn-helix domain-containing protein [Spirosoma arboris]
MNTLDEQKPLTASEAAKFLSISLRTFYQHLPAIKHARRFGKIYVQRADLLAYLNNQEANVAI